MTFLRSRHILSQKSPQNTGEGIAASGGSKPPSSPVYAVSGAHRGGDERRRTLEHHSCAAELTSGTNPSERLGVNIFPAGYESTVEHFFPTLRRMFMNAPQKTFQFPRMRSQDFMFA